MYDNWPKAIYKYESHMKSEIKNRCTQLTNRSDFIFHCQNMRKMRTEMWFPFMMVQKRQMRTIYKNHAFWNDFVRVLELSISIKFHHVKMDTTTNSLLAFNIDLMNLIFLLFPSWFYFIRCIIFSNISSVRRLSYISEEYEHFDMLTWVHTTLERNP